MYKCMYSAAGTMPMCCYCMMAHRNMLRPIMPMENQSMFREEEEFQENRMEPMHQPNMNSMGHQMLAMPNVGNQMSGMNTMQKKNMEMIESDTEEIVRMFEQQHPDILKRLTDFNMSDDEARQYLGTVVEISLSHHRMY